MMDRESASGLTTASSVPSADSASVCDCRGRGAVKGGGGGAAASGEHPALQSDSKIVKAIMRTSQKPLRCLLIWEDISPRCPTRIGTLGKFDQTLGQ